MGVTPWMCYDSRLGDFCLLSFVSLSALPTLSKGSRGSGCRSEVVLVELFVVVGVLYALCYNMAAWRDGKMN